RRRALADDADYFSLERQGLAGGDGAADARTHADRHVDGIEIGYRPAQLQGIGGDSPDQWRIEARYEMQLLPLRELTRVFECRREVIAELDEFRSERAHRC